MDERKPTPEEQLLKLIENPAAGAASATAQAQSASRSGKGLPSLGFLKAFSNLIKKPSAEIKSNAGRVTSHHPFPYVKGLNALLVAATIAAVIYLLLDLLVFKKTAQEVLTQVSIAENVFPVQSAEDQNNKRDIGYYQDLIDRRNPFVAGEKAKVEEKKPEAVRMPAVHSEKMSQVLQSLKLVGISWTGEIPLAMIEEVQSGKTFFLKQGQEINRLKVQRIDKEKITVTYEGEEADLF